MSAHFNRYTLKGINKWARRECPQAFEALTLEMSNRKTATYWHAQAGSQSGSQGGKLLDIGREPNNLFAGINSEQQVHFLCEEDLNSGPGLKPLPLSEVGHRLHPHYLDGVFRILLTADRKRCEGRVELLGSVLMYCFVKDGVIPRFVISTISKPEFFKEACFAVRNWEGLPYDGDDDNDDDETHMKEIKSEEGVPGREQMVEEETRELQEVRAEKRFRAQEKKRCRAQEKKLRAEKKKKLRAEKRSWNKDKAALERALADERKANSEKDEKLENKRKKMEEMSEEMKELHAEFADYKTRAEKRIREADEYKDKVNKKATELFQLN
ncbi:uncharacterized protein N0V89_007843 [Didymosphaeria variabile]|uniref:Uncharacterized protein n=1 Tax=Didymosphaeria variabile TaxID=1932322 RepID=A0A9W9CAL5_9PLEO|nr:uncharacterized protein N0V89_007843 [Didymosphaeria variabile]KAJ4352495.1 hypothetical protein N0V89_007843 [Didymosphaeria variabile]